MTIFAVLALVGLIGYFAYRFLVNTWTVPGPLKRTLQQARAQGAPPLPWVVGSEDRDFAERIAAMIGDADVAVRLQEVPGAFGPTLELVLRDGPQDQEPLAVLSRSWEPTERCMKTLLFFPGTVEGQLEHEVLRHGFKRGAPPEAPFAMFAR